MVAPSPSFQPAQAGALLAVVTLVAIGAGALLGWAAGSLAYGVIVGVVLGIPAGIVAVYKRYRGAL